MNSKNNLISYKNTGNIFDDVSCIIKQATVVAYKSVNVLLIQRNWLLGKRIVEEELSDKRSDNYGKEIIIELSKRLTKEFGKGFERRNIYYFVNFYKNFPNILTSLTAKSFLSWTHYVVLLRVFSKEARDW